MLLKRANAPLAVLRPPVVLLKSAPAPVAVFSFAVFSRSVAGAYASVEVAGGQRVQRIPAVACVVSASGKAEERISPSAVLPPA